VATRTHDFPGDGAGKAIPYGVYDITGNTGWVNVGTDHDTAAFAVESIRRWWKAAGQGACPLARRLLITADAGGSNGYRTRAWKAELAALAVETRLEITVCHFPPGTSKWNKIEHRLFSHITMNWRGRPLTSHEVIVQTIAATTTTATRLTVHLPQVAIAALFSVRPETINKRIRDVRQLLDQAGHTIQPSPHRLANLDDLYVLADAEGLIPSEIKTAC